MPWGRFDCFKYWVNYRLLSTPKSWLSENRKWEIWAKGALLLQSSKWKPGPGASVAKPGVYGCKGKNSLFSPRTIITITLHQVLPRVLLPGLAFCPLTEGFIFLPRVSNLSALQPSLVIWFLPRVISPLPALYFKNLIKATFLLLYKYDFYSHSKLNIFHNDIAQPCFFFSSLGKSTLLLGPKWRRIISHVPWLLNPMTWAGILTPTSSSCLWWTHESWTETWTELPKVTSENSEVS